MEMTAEIRDGEAVGTRFLDALAHQDWTGVEACFDAEAHFRALTPPGLHEATDSGGAVGYLRRWFGESTELQLVASAIESIQDRLSISYRFRVHEDGWYIVEQRAYCDVVAGRVVRMELLCSGFRPDARS